MPGALPRRGLRLLRDALRPLPVLGALLCTVALRAPQRVGLPVGAQPEVPLPRGRARLRSFFPSYAGRRTLVTIAAAP